MTRSQETSCSRWFNVRVQTWQEAIKYPSSFPKEQIQARIDALQSSCKENTVDSTESFIDEFFAWKHRNNLPDETDTSTLLERADLTAIARGRLVRTSRGGIQ